MDFDQFWLDLSDCDKNPIKFNQFLIKMLVKQLKMVELQQKYLKSIKKINYIDFFD